MTTFGRPGDERGAAGNAERMSTGEIALLLLSAPDGMDYYPKAGLEKFDNCFAIRRTVR